MEILLVYLWMQINNIIAGLAVITAFFLGCSIFYFMSQDIAAGYDKEQKLENNKKLRGIAEKYFYKAFAFICVIVAIPSQTTVAVMTGTYIAKETMSSPEAVKITSLIRLKANELLDAELKASVKK